MEPFQLSWIQKGAQYTAVTQVNAKKRRASDYHLQIAAESQKNDPFLIRLVTGDEKWLNYDNVKRKDRVRIAMSRRTWRSSHNQR